MRYEEVWSNKKIKVPGFLKNWRTTPYSFKYGVALQAEESGLRFISYGGGGDIKIEIGECLHENGEFLFFFRCSAPIIWTGWRSIEKFLTRYRG